jgi:lipoprotein-releasing system permease protein
VYKVLLCWRYLHTRYLAMVCIVSVMLGVATLIVVNSVMSGFSTKLKDRLHSLLSDVDVEAWNQDGFSDPQGKMRLIRSDPWLDERIESMSASLECYAMMEFDFLGNRLSKAVRLIGVDPERRASVGGFAEHLTRPGRPVPSFEFDPEAWQRYQFNHPHHFKIPDPILAIGADGKPPPDAPPEEAFKPKGIIVGYAIAHYRQSKPDENKNKEIETLHPGDDVLITTVSGARMSPVNYRYAVVDYFKSEMSEYDSNYVFVPLDHLQHLRTMEDRVTSIQIRLKNIDRDRTEVVKRLRAMFEGAPIQVMSWEEKQGALLAAISIEKGILNVLLFMIVAVAGFGILAIFSMIVVEKTRDVGILKSLGASNGGVMSIFLTYGLLLGLIGAGLGTLAGVTITVNINEIEHYLSSWTGIEIFNRDVYYFKDIPFDIQPWTLILVNVGSVAIAVLFSVLPALRAAMLHPVRALRYE